MKPLTCYNATTRENVMVGLFRDDKVFIANRKPEHVFRKYNGLGLSFNVLNELKTLGCRKIIFLLHLDNDITEKFETTVERFLKHGIVWRDKEYDWQRILSFNMMKQMTFEEFQEAV